MKMPFPGMDPYLEHPVLWQGVHARLTVALANQLQPRLDPRYVVSVEARVFIDWEVEKSEIHEARIEILDAYNGMKLVTMIELVSPTNKAAGPGRESYQSKQQEALARDCHLVEIDLLRRGRHALSIPKRRTVEVQPYDYLACVNRYPHRKRFELYPRRLRQRLPRVRIPLADPDPAVPLDIQAALEQVYWDGRYMRRVRYDEPCVPRLRAKDQQWVNERWTAYRAAHPELFPNTGG